MLLRKLIEKQRSLGLSDRQFAARLRIPRSTWQLTRTGKVPLGPRVARAAQAAFPEFAPDAIYFLLSGGTELTSSASQRDTVPTDTAEIADREAACTP